MLLKNTIKRFHLILFLFFVSFMQHATEEIHDIDIYKSLENIDEIRTSDPKSFSILLSEISNKQDLMSKAERYFFDYLNAYKLIYIGKSQEALPLLHIILLADDSDPLIKFRSRLTIINLHGIEQNWTKGLFHLSIILKELPKISNHRTKVNAYVVAAMFYNQIGQYSLGLKYAQSLTEIASTPKNICWAKTIEIESKFNLKQLNNLDSNIENSIISCKDEMIPRNFIRSYNAKLNLENNKPIEVINILSPYLKEVTATRYPRLIVEINTLLAEAYWLQENLEKAKEFALKSTEIGKNISTTQAVVAAYKLLYKIAKKQSNHQEIALQYHEIYAELDKTYIDETKAKYLAFQLAAHKELEQKNQIALLNKENALLSAERALIKANADNKRFIILILTIVISILLLWGYRLLKAHKRIKQLAEYDHLTGIYNRGHFSQIANAGLDYCKSAGQELSIIMFDLDYFKKVNDNYGHACGDWALKNVIHACKAIGRQNDIFARLGGEEFCILLTSCDKDSAYQRAETYRQAIADINTKESGFDFNITASFGVTDTKTSGYDLEKILADADSAAYSSKYAGRNQVTIFQAKTQKEKNSTELDSSRNAF